MLLAKGALPAISEHRMKSICHDTPCCTNAHAWQNPSATWKRCRFCTVCATCKWNSQHDGIVNMMNIKLASCRTLRPAEPEAELLQDMLQGRDLPVRSKSGHHANMCPWHGATMCHIYWPSTLWAFHCGRFISNHSSNVNEQSHVILIAQSVSAQDQHKITNKYAGLVFSTSNKFWWVHVHLISPGQEVLRANDKDGCPAILWFKQETLFEVQHLSWLHLIPQLCLPVPTERKTLDEITFVSCTSRFSQTSFKSLTSRTLSDLHLPVPSLGYADVQSLATSSSDLGRSGGLDASGRVYGKVSTIPV